MVVSIAKLRIMLSSMNIVSNESIQRYPSHCIAFLSLANITRFYSLAAVNYFWGIIAPDKTKSGFPGIQAVNINDNFIYINSPTPISAIGIRLQTQGTQHR